MQIRFDDQVPSAPKNCVLFVGAVNISMTKMLAVLDLDACTIHWVPNVFAFIFRDELMTTDYFGKLIFPKLEFYVCISNVSNPIRSFHKP